MILCELEITLAQSSVACIGIVFAEFITVFLSVVVSYKLADAHFSKLLPGTFYTVCLKNLLKNLG